jgi:small subunit ribosomal protein S5
MENKKPRRYEEVQEVEWFPKTELGRMVKAGKIKTIEEALTYRILEPEIVDKLLNLKVEILNAGQAKGKFGGGKRRAWRQTQKKTGEGTVVKFSAFVVVGDGNGYIGFGSGKAKETLPARDKATRKAKLDIHKIKRACSSFDCTCGEEHTVPFAVDGKCGSCRVYLYPAPQGTGLVAGDEVKKILKIAGIKDVYSRTTGNVRTTFNLGKACIDALNKTTLK